MEVLIKIAQGEPANLCVISYEVAWAEGGALAKAGTRRWMLEDQAMRPELVDGVWQLTWNLPTALALGVVWLLALASGWASLRYLRAAPDLPYKAELVWGARWLAPIGLAWFLLTTAACAVGMSRTPYAFTCMRLSYLGFVGLIPLLLLLPRQAAGWLACLHGLSAQVRGRPPEWETWVATDAAHQTWQGRWLLPVIFALLLGVWLYITLTDYIRVDVTATRMERGHSLTRALEARLADSGVEEIVVVLFTRPHRVGVRLREGTSEEALKEAKRRVQEALSELGEKGKWVIRVYASGDSKAQSGDDPGQPAPRGATDAD